MAIMIGCCRSTKAASGICDELGKRRLCIRNALTSGALAVSYHNDMKAASKDYKYPLRLPDEDAKAVAMVCRESRASFNRVVSLCVRKALPSVREALVSDTGRVTNIDPLSAKVARRLYKQADDDAESIRLFMAAQVTDIEE
jgi:hypothetical protein